MPAWAVLGLAVAGGLGAVTRFLLDTVITARTRRRFPIATIVINVSGSLVLGFVTGLAAAHALPPEWRIIVGTGFLGGYTTFSTAMLDAVALWRDGERGAAVFDAVGMLVLGLLAAGLGLALGAAL